MSDQAGKRILVVEGDLLWGYLMKELLASEGYDVSIATNGPVGLRKMRQGGWDLVLLDMKLPEKDGLHILQALKAQPPKRPNGQVVVLTDLGTEDLVGQAFELGASYYVTKPAYTPGQLVMVVNNLLDKS